jgi:excinuclease ABC subunit B
MRAAIDETTRRREIQRAYNRDNGIEPIGIVKAVRDITASLRESNEPRAAYQVRKDMPKDELARVIKDLEREMRASAKELEFEKAALLRDEMTDLKKLLIAQDVVDRGEAGTTEPEYRAYPDSRPLGRGRGRRRGR